MKIDIRHRDTSAILYSTEVGDDDPNPARTTLVRAVGIGANLSCANLVYANLRDANLSDADLRGANLSGANLSGADLRGANLSGADLVYADLRDANLSDADLRGANLRDANLSDADLRGANLRDANLSDADLRGANLSGANLSGADLRGANLSGADLRGVRCDLRAVLDSAPDEVVGLLTKLEAGEIDGNVYQGECACLVGTIANLKGVDYTTIPNLAPNGGRPAERWFLAIGKGATPDNNPVAAITHDWICEWLAERGEGPWMVES
jgi:uncharacterized protein YjbI with pentapeptide repeats